MKSSAITRLNKKDDVPINIFRNCWILPRNVSKFAGDAREEKHDKFRRIFAFEYQINASSTFLFSQSFAYCYSREIKACSSALTDKWVADTFGHCEYENIISIRSFRAAATCCIMHRSSRWNKCTGVSGAVRSNNEMQNAYLTHLIFIPSTRTASRYMCEWSFIADRR